MRFPFLGHSSPGDSNPSKEQEKAIRSLRAALQAHSIEHHPQDFAAIHVLLANIYRERSAGERNLNIEEAIRSYLEALRVYTIDAFPVEYAGTQNNLGASYEDRKEGDRGDNLEVSIRYLKEALRFRTLEAFPTDYAATQHNLSISYRERLKGERHDNLEDAIRCAHEALRVYTHADFPIDYALVQSNLGNIFQQRIAGARRDNLEQAIRSYHEALTVYKGTKLEKYGTALNNLGNAYRERIEGARRLNIEEAIRCYHEALQVRTIEAFPADYAMTHNNLSIAYHERIEGDLKDNLEMAIYSLQEALRVYTLDTFPYYYARAQNNLGNAYLQRRVGGLQADQEAALRCYHEALRVYSLDAFPTDYALTLHSLGNAYQVRRTGERRANLEESLRCYHEALKVWTLQDFPIFYATTQANMAGTYRARALAVDESDEDKRADLEKSMLCLLEALQVYTLEADPSECRRILLNLAKVEGALAQWAQLAATYTQAMAAEDLLVSFAGGVAGQAAVLRDGQKAASRGAFALATCERLGEAAVLVEQGRARGMASALALDIADPEQIGDAERRRRYIDARGSLLATQSYLNEAFTVGSDLDLDTLPRDWYARHIALDDATRAELLKREAAFQSAKDVFDAVVSEIQTASDPADFLQPALGEETILRAASRVGTDHALVYLLATPWGGLALAALAGNPESGKGGHFAALNLPDLTESLVEELLEQRDGTDANRILSGYGPAQDGSGFQQLCLSWEGATLQAKAEALHHANLVAEDTSTFDITLQMLLGIPRFGALAKASIEDLLSGSEAQRHEGKLLDETFGGLLLQQELKRCLHALANAGLRDLAVWLHKEVGAATATLVPCGALAAFPLLAAEVAPGVTLAERMPMSMVPSARALLKADDSPTQTAHLLKAQRLGVYAVGDPQYDSQPLPWGEAEALAVMKLARRAGLLSEAHVQAKARRGWLVEKLQTGAVVDASCHGYFDVSSPLDSALVLAGAERLTLRDALSHHVDLRGLRLLILSACQTAIIDLRGVRDEVRSLAAGMYQAGADAVLGTLWSVDDKASYLLMTRFAQLWLPNMETMPPAQALAQAQHWLRTSTWKDLAQWHAEEITRPTSAGHHDPYAALRDDSQLVVFRGRGLRYSIRDITNLLETTWQSHAGEEVAPYADPIYWAAFQVTGW